MSIPEEGYRELVSAIDMVKARISVVSRNSRDPQKSEADLSKLKDELIQLLEDQIAMLQDKAFISHSLPHFLKDVSDKTDVYNGDEPWLEQMVYHPKRADFPFVAISPVSVVSKLVSSLKHWKKNHDHQVTAGRLLKERTDVPVERVVAFNATIEAFEKLEAIKAILEK